MSFFTEPEVQPGGSAGVMPSTTGLRSSVHTGRKYTSGQGFTKISADILLKMGQFLTEKEQFIFWQSNFAKLSPGHNNYAKEVREHLVNVTCFGCRSPKIDKIVSQSPNLVKLDLRCAESFKIRKLLVVKNTLKDLDLSYIKLDSLWSIKLNSLWPLFEKGEEVVAETLTQLTALTTLNLSGLSFDATNNLLPRLTALPKLSELVVSANDSNGKWVDQVNLNFASLSSLSCLEVNFFDRYGLDCGARIFLLFSRCKELKAIRLVGNSTVIGELLKVNPEFLSRIKELDLTKVEFYSFSVMGVDHRSIFRKYVDQVKAEYPKLKILVPPAPLPKSEVPAT